MFRTKCICKIRLLLKELKFTKNLKNVKSDAQSQEILLGLHQITLSMSSLWLSLSTRFRSVQTFANVPQAHRSSWFHSISIQKVS